MPIYIEMLGTGCFICYKALLLSCIIFSMCEKHTSKLRFYHKCAIFQCCHFSGKLIKKKEAFSSLNVFARVSVRTAASEATFRNLSLVPPLLRLRSNISAAPHCNFALAAPGRLQWTSPSHEALSCGGPISSLAPGNYRSCHLPPPP